MLTNILTNNPPPSSNKKNIASTLTQHMSNTITYLNEAMDRRYKFNSRLLHLRCLAHSNEALGASYEGLLTFFLIFHVIVLLSYFLLLLYTVAFLRRLWEQIHTNSPLLVPSFSRYETRGMQVMCTVFLFYITIKVSLINSLYTSINIHRNSHPYFIFMLP